MASYKIPQLKSSELSKRGENKEMKNTCNEEKAAINREYIYATISILYLTMKTLNYTVKNINQSGLKRQDPKQQQQKTQPMLPMISILFYYFKRHFFCFYFQLHIQYWLDFCHTSNMNNPGTYVPFSLLSSHFLPIPTLLCYCPDAGKDLEAAGGERDDRE